MNLKKLLLFLTIPLLICGCSDSYSQYDKLVTPSHDIEPNTELVFKEYEEGYEVAVGNAKKSTKIVIPSTYNGKPVVKLSNDAFLACINLEWVYIPNSVYEFGNQVFYNCLALNVINIPKSVVTFGWQPFTNVKNCNFIFEAEENERQYEFKIDSSCFKVYGYEDYGVHQSVLYGMVGNRLSIIKVLTAKQTYQIPEVLIVGDQLHQITSIGYKAFSFAKEELSELTISKNIITIHERAFEGCSKLRMIYIPDNVLYIKEYCFLGCTNVVIYCQASSKPSTWDPNWNPEKRTVAWSR